MRNFEELCMEKYLREKKSVLLATQEEQIRVIKDRYNYVECFFIFFECVN